MCSEEKEFSQCSVYGEEGVVCMHGEGEGVVCMYGEGGGVVCMYGEGGGVVCMYSEGESVVCMVRGGCSVYGEEGVVCMDVLTSSVSLPEPSIRRKPLTYLDVSDQ